MALFPASALRSGVRKREVFGWAMYDFANSGYTTVVITAVFAAYFVGGIAKGAPWAAFAWTAALSISYAIVMLTMPAIGAWADLRGAKKRVLVVATTGCVLATAALALTPRFAGASGGVALAMLLVIISNAFYSYGESLTGAFLPELATPEGMGKVSGWGWSFGYVGGMLTLGICLAYVLWSQARGLPASHFVPVTMLITAAIYGGAACATFALLPERAQPKTARGELGAWQQLRATYKRARAYRDFMWLLVCTVCYQGGVAVAITLAAIYAEQVIGFVASETMVLIFVLNVAAAVGAFSFGYIQDRIGHKVSLAVTLVAWVAVCVIAAVVTTKGGFLVGRCHRRARDGLEPVRRPRDDRLPRAAAATGGVLRALDFRDPAGQHHRPAELRRDHLGHGRQPAHRDPLDRGAVRGGVAVAAADRHAARPRGRAAQMSRQNRLLFVSGQPALLWNFQLAMFFTLAAKFAMSVGVGEAGSIGPL